MNHNFGQERDRCTEELHTHLSHQGARDILFDLCLRQAEKEMVGATEDEIHDRANELLREME